MALHFNLKGMFLFCVGLAFWHFLLPGMLYAAAVGLVGFLAYLYKKRQNIAADLVFAVAFGLNLWYVAASFGNVRQYDYYNFFMHADYFVSHNFFVSSPVLYFQSVYFQPPLWGLIAGVVTKLCMLFGAAKESGFDYVRFISLFCVSGAGIMFWRLTDVLKFTSGVKLGVFCFLLFFPASGIMANLVNNDAPVYFLMTAMLYQAYMWQQQGQFRNAVCLSGLLFLAGMTKFSGLMVAPGIGVLWLFSFIAAKNKFDARLWGEGLIIGVGAVLGFGWGIFLLYYGFPLVPPPVEEAMVDYSAIAPADRVFDFSGFSFSAPFATPGRGGEANVILALIKTALFGEWTWAGNFAVVLMYGLAIVFAIIAAGLFFSLWSYKLGDNFSFNAFIVVLCFTVVGAWAHFWLNYPYFCSSEFRYVMILLPVSLLWVGNFLSQKSLPKAVYAVLAGGCGLFIAARVMLYLNTI